MAPSTVAFDSPRAKQRSLDATGEQQLTQPEEGWIDDHPDWSPDGRQIAYQSCAEGKPCSVWIVAADGGKPRKVRFRCRLKGDCDAASVVMH